MMAVWKWAPAVAAGNDDNKIFRSVYDGHHEIRVVGLVFFRPLPEIPVRTAVEIADRHASMVEKMLLNVLPGKAVLGDFVRVFRPEDQADCRAVRLVQVVHQPHAAHRSGDGFQITETGFLGALVDIMDAADTDHANRRFFDGVSAVDP